MCQLCFFMTDKNVPGDILKNHIESNFMQSNLIFLHMTKLSQAGQVFHWSRFCTSSCNLSICFDTKY